MSAMPPTLPYSFKLTFWNRLKMSLTGIFVILFGLMIFYVGLPTKDLVALSSAGVLVAIGLGLMYVLATRPTETVVVSDSGIFLAFVMHGQQTTIPWDDIIGFSKLEFRRQQMLLILTKSAALKAEQNVMSGIANYAVGMMAKGAGTPGVSIPDMWLGMKVDKAIEILEAIHSEKAKA